MCALPCYAALRCARLGSMGRLHRGPIAHRRHCPKAQQITYTCLPSPRRYIKMVVPGPVSAPSGPAPKPPSAGGTQTLPHEAALVTLQLCGQLLSHTTPHPACSSSLPLPRWNGHPLQHRRRSLSHPGWQEALVRMPPAAYTSCAWCAC